MQLYISEQNLSVSVLEGGDDHVTCSLTRKLMNVVHMAYYPESHEINSLLISEKYYSEYITDIIKEADIFTRAHIIKRTSTFTLCTIVSVFIKGERRQE